MTERRFDLVAFDIDGTLILHPNGKVVWQVLNQRFGTSPEAAARRYADHAAGRISYAEWVRLDIEDWQRHGASRDAIVTELLEFELVEGARETLAALTARGYALAAVSGTLDILVETVFPEHPFAHLYTNRIEFGPDGLIAGWQATPYDFDGKARALRELSAVIGVPLSRMAFLGDDINDVAAAEAVGLAIAVRPRSTELSAVCDLTVTEGSLEQVLVHFP